MKLPLYLIVGIRPVMAIGSEDGEMDVLSYDWETGAMKRDMSQLEVVVLREREHAEVSKAVFDAYVEELRQGQEPRWYEEFEAAR